MLANEIQADLVLPDEAKAGKSALKTGFKVMGRIGMPVADKRLGLIENVKTDIKKLQEAKFRLSEKVVRTALKRAGELE